MALADKVKELRQKLGWNQATLAKEAKITPATISRMESGKVTQPKIGQLQKIADALGVTIDYLAGDSVRMSKGTISLLFLWKLRLRYYAEGKRLRAESKRFWAKSDRLRAEGKRLNAESKRFWAESDRLWAESNRLRA